METLKIKAVKINGTNGLFVRTGNATYSFEGECYEPEKSNVKYSFIVEGIDDTYNSKISTAEENAKYFALNAVQRVFCGYFEENSVKNFKKISP